MPPASCMGGRLSRPVLELSHGYPVLSNGRPLRVLAWRRRTSKGSGMIDPKHDVVVEYCVPWNCLDEAVRAAVEIATGWAPVLRGIELRSGVKGVFKVSIDGEIVLDKARLGRFPHPEEMMPAVQERLGAKLHWRKSERT